MTMCTTFDDQGCLFNDKMIEFGEVAVDNQCFEGLGLVLAQLNGMSESDVDDSEGETELWRILSSLERDEQTKARADAVLAQLAKGNIKGVFHGSYDLGGGVKTDAVSKAVHKRFFPPVRRLNPQAWAEELARMREQNGHRVNIDLMAISSPWHAWPLFGYFWLVLKDRCPFMMS